MKNLNLKSLKVIIALIFLLQLSTSNISALSIRVPNPKAPELDIKKTQPDILINPETEAQSNIKLEQKKHDINPEINSTEEILVTENTENLQSAQ